jgi:hypothetical protein
MSKRVAQVRPVIGIGEKWFHILSGLGSAARPFFIGRAKSVHALLENLRVHYFSEAA